MFCYNEYRQEISNYPLDRIEKIEINSSIHYKDNTVGDFSTYFEDIIGVSKNKEDNSPQKIQIWISAKQWPYFETKPLHGSQSVVERREDGSVVVQIEVAPNWELEQLILSQCEHMSVLSPESLRIKLKERIAKALASYQ